MAEKNTTVDLDNQPQLFGHPVGLYVLFFTEMWERFSYYGMRAILTLYMYRSATSDNAGLGWDKADALALYGWYTMMVYVLAIPGGILADKFIGQKKSIILGGFILVVGHSILAVEQAWAFYTGLVLIVIGVGALKPNISTLVGGLYKKGDQSRRDQGFTIFYIGINVGAFLASIIVGLVGEKYGWHYGFGLAGIGMLIGQITFIWGTRYLVGVGDPPVKGSAGVEDGSSSLGTLVANLFKNPLQLVITGLLIGGSILMAFKLNDDGFNRYAYMGLGVFLSIVAGILMMVYKDINKVEKDRFVVLLISYLIVIVFWGAFEQAGGLMNIYTDLKIDRNISLWMVDVLFIGFGGVLLFKAIQYTRKKKDTNKLFFALSAIVFVVYALAKFKYLKEDPFEIPASVFQSVNALFIMIFGTIIGGFWIWWARKGKENSSLFKMALGTVIMGIGFIFMAMASANIDVYGDKAAVILLILAYLFHTIGELCASPVALSFITKVAPIKYVSLMMGLYFAASGLGNKVAATIGEATQAESVKVELIAGAPIQSFVADSILAKAKDFEVVAKAHLEGDKIVAKIGDVDASALFNLKGEEGGAHLREFMQSVDGLKEYTLIYRLGYDEMQKVEVDEGRASADLTKYSGNIEVFEYQDEKEYKTFLGIFIFTAVFGLLLLLFLKKLKRLTHGAEDESVVSGGH